MSDRWPRKCSGAAPEPRARDPILLFRTLERTRNPCRPKISTPAKCRNLGGGSVMMVRQEEGMRRMKSTAVWTAMVMAGLAGGWQVTQAQAPASSQTPAAAAPADTVALRAQ